MLPFAIPLPNSTISVKLFIQIYSIFAEELYGMFYMLEIEKYYWLHQYENKYLVKKIFIVYTRYFDFIIFCRPTYQKLKTDLHF